MTRGVVGGRGTGVKRINNHGSEKGGDVLYGGFRFQLTSDASQTVKRGIKVIKDIYTIVQDIDL